MPNDQSSPSPAVRLGPALALLAAATAPGMAAAMPCTNMALVLAIDGSGSISDAEFSLQLAATANAIRDPDVVQAMAGLGGVAVTALLWGDTSFGTHALDWVRIADPASADLFAARLASQPRVVSGNTDMGQGINAALDLLDHPDNCASYNVIDVSGDGRETLYSNRRGASLSVARQRAQDNGVVINGLAISTNDQGLVDYYLTHVISGTDAFVIEATSFTTFAQAMERKLLREVGGYAYTLTAQADPTP